MIIYNLYIIFWFKIFQKSISSQSAQKFKVQKLEDKIFSWENRVILFSTEYLEHPDKSYLYSRIN